ncbi:hypothetical protein HY091_03385 [Candidatus Kaiserbacteria bacterium]|nr:hypothetical protein [Candidatus Kaiserbacteria bacterium]
MPKPLRSLGKIALTAATLLLLAAGVSYAQSTWTEPSQSPPDGNVSAPVNVGSIFQQKTGDFWAAKVGSDNGYCIGPSCITAWPVVPPYQTDIAVTKSCNGYGCLSDAVTAAKLCQLSGYSHLVSAVSGGSYVHVCAWQGTGWGCDQSCTTSCRHTELTRVSCDNHGTSSTGAPPPNPDDPDAGSFTPTAPSGSSGGTPITY